jgi:hypothetical protein
MAQEHTEGTDKHLHTKIVPFYYTTYCTEYNQHNRNCCSIHTAFSRCHVFVGMRECQRIMSMGAGMLIINIVHCMCTICIHCIDMSSVS